jgi:hypothetical protein
MTPETPDQRPDFEAIAYNEFPGKESDFQLRKVFIKGAEHAWSLAQSSAPKWYSKDEIYHQLIAAKYSHGIADELSTLWANDLQGAFNKGFEKAKREDEKLLTEKDIENRRLRALEINGCSVNTIQNQLVKIQELNQKVEDKEREIAELKARHESREKEVDFWREGYNRLSRNLS